MKDIDCHHSEALPSYNESQGEQPQQSLTLRIAAVQRERIENLLAKYIDPLLESQAVSGMLRMAFALVPSDIEELHHSGLFEGADTLDKNAGTFQPKTTSATGSIEGFAKNENLKVVRLHGEENNARFWVQRSVVRQLEQEVRRRVVPSSEMVEKNNVEPPCTAPKKESKGFLGRLLGRPAPPPNKSPKGKIGLAGTTIPGVDYVEISVGVEELCIRHMTQIVLYDTRCGKTIVVRVRFGGS